MMRSSHRRKRPTHMLRSLTAITALAAIGGIGCQAAPASGQFISHDATAWRTANRAPASSAAPNNGQPTLQMGEEGSYQGAASQPSRSNPPQASSKAASDPSGSPSLKNPTMVPIVEEELQVGTRMIEGDRVRIRITPTETSVRESVQLKTEHIVVEHEQGKGRPIDINQHAFEPKTIELTEMTEIPMAGIRPVVTNIVTIRKEERQRTERVQDWVRGTTVDVVREPKPLPQDAGRITMLPSTHEPNAAIKTAVENHLVNNTLPLPASVAEVKQSLTIEKREVPQAIVRVQIRPTERPVEQTVSLREEHVIVERTPVTESASGHMSPDLFKDKVLTVKTQKEVPVISKRPVLKEMLTIRKDIGTQEQTIEAKLLEESVATNDLHASAPDASR
jgi:stress response protein YsnF